MAAASVMIPLSSIDLNGGVLPPSALVQHSPRHGRSRGASLKGKSAKGRRYSVLENREVAISKAVAFVLKRSVRESEVDDDDEEVEHEHKNLVSDEEGWVSVTDLLEHSRISDLNVTPSDLKRIESANSKGRFTLRQDPTDESRYQIRGTHKRDSVQAPVLEGEQLKPDSEELPEFIVYETTYEAYPHILAAGGIQKAAGADHISFSPIAIAEDGSESRPSRATDADIGIWVHLKSVMDAEPSIVWHRSSSGSIFTSDEVPKDLWKKAVARRPEVGVLFEDGEVRKEVPEALRGKGTKGRGKKGKVSMKGRDKEDSDSASDE